jgi:hypothetical protein
LSWTICFTRTSQLAFVADTTTAFCFATTCTACHRCSSVLQAELTAR